VRVAVPPGLTQGLKEIGTSLRTRQTIVGLGLIAIAAGAITLSWLLESQSQPSSSRPEVTAPPVTRRQLEFPDTSNTGIPAGTTLRRVPSQVSSGPGWRFEPGGWVDVYGHGAVLSDLYIPYNLNITASDVTINAVQVVTGGPHSIGISLRHTHDVTITNSVISGINTHSGRMMTGIKDIFSDSTGMRVLSNDISRFETGVQLESGLVEGNYIHGPGFIAGDHTNGIMSNGGSAGFLTIEHNTVLIDRGQTDAIGLFEDFGVQRNRLIVDNLLAGGGYAIYAGQKPDGPRTSNIVITGNRISTIYYARGGHYGCAVFFDTHGYKNAWSRNVLNATPLTSYGQCD
jgi:hypothetical protein